MKGSRWISGRPPGIRPFWWGIGLMLWALVLVGAAAAVIVGSSSLTTVIASVVDQPIWRFVPGVSTPDFRMATRAGPAPHFTLPLFDGETFRLADQRGKVVVVNFWASWCVPCRAEAPRLESAYQAYRDRGVVFIGVDIEDTRTDAQRFIKELGLRYPSGADQGLRISQAYGVTGIPTTFFVDRNGQIRQHWVGEIHKEQLTAFIEEALR